MKRKLAIICSKKIAHDKLRMRRKKRNIEIVKVLGMRRNCNFSKKGCWN
jgi:hypothetical protein